MEPSTNTELEDKTAAIVDLDLTEVPRDEVPLSPEARAGLNAVLELEDRRAGMLQRAETEAEAAEGLAAEIRGAEDALKRAEASAITDPGDDNDAAVEAARGRLEDLTSTHAKHARAGVVLSDEAANLVAEIGKARTDAFDVVMGQLTKLGTGALDEVRSRMADLVRPLRQQGAVIHMTAILNNGRLGYNDQERLGEIERFLVLGGASAKSWQGFEGVSSLRAAAAYLSPRPDSTPQGWVTDESMAERHKERGHEVATERAKHPYRN